MKTFSSPIWLVAIAATAVLGAPTESFPSSGLHVRGDSDQGDGFYLAIPNEETGETDIQFTPLAEITARAPAEEVTAADSANLFKRATTCSGRRSNNVADLDNANRQLARNGAAQGLYAAGAHGWAHVGQETSFFCNYQSNYLTYNLIIDMHIVVSNRCGQNGYGYDHRKGGGGASDLVVGRTWRGDHFC